MLNLRYQSAFKRDYKRIRKRGYDVQRLESIIEMLAKEQVLPEECRDHDLGGTWSSTPSTITIWSWSSAVPVRTAICSDNHKEPLIKSPMRESVGKIFCLWCITVSVCRRRCLPTAV